jgi:type I restriction enzyme S subunit
MDGFAGAIGVSDSSGKCSPEYVILEPSTDGVHPHYYALLLRHLALRGLFTALCPSVRERAPRVRFSDFGSFVLPKPTFEEQQLIVDQVREAAGGFDRALRHVREQLARAQEYRTRLITDCVTGQLDVRAAVQHIRTDAEGTELSLLPEVDDVADGEAA